MSVCGGATKTDSEGNLTEYKHVNITGGCLRIGGAYRILKQEELITEVRENGFTPCGSAGQVFEAIVSDEDGAIQMRWDDGTGEAVEYPDSFVDLQIMQKLTQKYWKDSRSSGSFSQENSECFFY